MKAANIACNATFIQLGRPIGAKNMLDDGKTRKIDYTHHCPSRNHLAFKVH